MVTSQKLLSALLLAALVALSTTAVACHTPHQCPILQGMTGGAIPAPLPPSGDTYKVIGFRDGIRFYVIQYNDKIYRGGDILSRAGAESLRTLGIKTIIAVTPNDQERTLAREFGFKLVEIPFGWYDMKKADLDQFLAAVDAGPTPVYVHCMGGDLRAGILAAHYRIHREGWTFDRAIEEYRRLDANYWDSLDLVKVLKENAGK
jgi:protein tyrosine phosphatase (PTP) superfamily phosphohydrolase (DUF442 family)